MNIAERIYEMTPEEAAETMLYIKYAQDQLDRAVTYCAEEDYIPGTTQEQQEYNRAQIKYWEDALEEVPF